MAKSSDPAQRYGGPAPEQQQPDVEKTQDLDQQLPAEDREALREAAAEMQAAGVETDKQDYEVAPTQEANQPVMQETEPAAVDRYAAAPEVDQQQPEMEPEP